MNHLHTYYDNATGTFFIETEFEVFELDEDDEVWDNLDAMFKEMGFDCIGGTDEDGNVIPE